MNWQSKTHVLKFPVIIEGKTIAAITLREPDVDALEKIDGLGLKEGVPPNVKQVRGIIEALADQPGIVIGKLNKADFQALGELAVPLLEPAQEGSGQPSSNSSNGEGNTPTA